MLVFWGVVCDFGTSKSPDPCMMNLQGSSTLRLQCVQLQVPSHGSGFWKTTRGSFWGKLGKTPIFFIGWQDWPASSFHLCSQKMIHFEDVHIPPRKINVERPPKWCFVSSLKHFQAAWLFVFMIFMNITPQKFNSPSLKK